MGGAADIHALPPALTLSHIPAPNLTPTTTTTTTTNSLDAAGSPASVLQQLCDKVRVGGRGAGWQEGGRTRLGKALRLWLIVARGRRLQALGTAGCYRWGWAWG